MGNQKWVRGKWLYDFCHVFCPHDYLKVGSVLKTTINCLWTHAGSQPLTPAATLSRARRTERRGCGKVLNVNTHSLLLNAVIKMLHRHPTAYILGESQETA